MSEGLRILALVTGAFGERGGIASYNRALCRALAADPNVQSVILLPRRADAPGEGPVKACQLAPIANPFAYALAAVVIALRERPDIVFCGHLNMSWLGVIVARLAGARLVLQAHGVEAWSSPAGQRAAAAKADLVLCVSRDTRARLMTWSEATPERAVVVPNTVAARFTPGDRTSARTRFGLGDARLILCVGRLNAHEGYKGQDLAIGLIGDLRAKGHEVVLVIAGDGDDRPRLEALAQAQGVADQVRFLGHVCDDALLDLYRSADLYLMPSKGEGFGIVFLEAMACGTSAIGLAAGGAADALGRGLGSAVTEDDLLQAVDNALSSPAPELWALSAETHRRYGEAAFGQRIRRVLARLGSQ